MVARFYFALLLYVGCIGITSAAIREKREQQRPNRGDDIHIESGNEKNSEEKAGIHNGTKKSFFSVSGRPKFALDLDEDEALTSFVDLPISGIREAPIFPESKPAAGDSSNTSNKTSSGVASWVFITVGATAASVVVSIFLLTLLYKRRAGGQDGVAKRRSTEELERGASLLRESSQPRDKDQGRPEDIPMLNLLDPINRSSSLYEDEEVHYARRFKSMSDDPSLPSAPLKIPRPQIYSQCVGSNEEEYCAPDTAGLRNDGNRLRGGNVEFQRRYVEDPYVSSELRDFIKASKPLHVAQPSTLNSRQSSIDPCMISPSSDGGRNGSSASSTASHHSARSYISIPPTSRSNNYVDACYDCLSLRSEKGNPAPIKMEWLTKSFKPDRKNELSSYQASTGVQTDNNDTSTPEVKTVLNTPWQFGGAFTTKGGILQAKDSDVSLSVPANAVHQGQVVDIYGAIFTDTSPVRKKIKFPKEESLITPVVEYYKASSVSNFNRPLHLHMPHALPEGFDEALIKVYVFSAGELGEVTTLCLPHKRQCQEVSNHEDAFWQKSQDGSKIIITTSHFSGYFCTLCETTSLPSICTMVFGSHVQAAEHRREIRVVLYIWDRRLAIKDYLERFRQQEKDVDRQLLTDMQVPLLNKASGDSRLVMRMEVLGSDSDRQCWRHVARPGGSRLLFKPLQVRRLSEIVQCCRHTDPIRVEWALENHPDVAPGPPTFQCCIDIMHASESVCDYEAALSEDLDDLMRTFYVRDLPVTPREGLQPTLEQKFDRTNLQRTLSENLDLEQTEKICLELGFASKDIGNFHKKFRTESEIQDELVKECLRRLGPDKLSSQLPALLDKLCLSQVLTSLNKSAAGDKQNAYEQNLYKSFALPAKVMNVQEDCSLTARKSLLNESTNVYHQPHQLRQLAHQVSDTSEDVFPITSPGYSHKTYGNERDVAHTSSANRLTNTGSQSRPQAAPSSGSSSQNNNMAHRGINNAAEVQNRLSSSSGYESANHHHQRDSCSTYTETNVSSMSSRPARSSVARFSVTAHADTLEYNPMSSDGLSGLTSCTDEGKAYPEITEELCRSTSGPVALSAKIGENREVMYQQNGSRDETSKKEMYGIHTVV